MIDIKTILYVDDEPINIILFEEHFNVNYTVITAGSGFEALDLLNSFNDIKIVISDMKMPGMNGLEFIKIAKEKFPNTFYFILSAYGISNEITEALKNHLISQYFSKPFDMDEIEKTIREVNII
jgi:two-component system, response regulator, stage 0 sporulation protein F